MTLLERGTDYCAYRRKQYRYDHKEARQQYIVFVKFVFVAKSTQSLAASGAEDHIFVNLRIAFWTVFHIWIIISHYSAFCNA